eukprot:CAMPEP_0170514212 /NCGR_PEP_ID=MMETSP0209-20121228/770_1 /TAXON_ID=665100 ORGANISM="Litonotus pictus, Strain P1" /NCGR_SAMPLE_ID=MMETSP0209 /ASSEMBLY_ACC=CAM_ASM_000301 /LENGTH=764 /DNA_ID=CAMNT_0010798215 /DNA_START=125 /DNA_END=2416 /DNA_ORIENTATION=-
MTKTERLYGDSAVFNIKPYCETSIFSPQRFLTNNIEDIIREHSFSPISKLRQIAGASNSNSNVISSDNEIQDVYTDLQKGISVKGDENTRKDLRSEFSYVSLMAAFLSKINRYLNRHINSNGATNNHSSVISGVNSHERTKMYYTFTVPDFFSLQERNKFIDSLKVSTISNLQLKGTNSKKTIDSGNSFLINQPNKEVFLLNESSAITLFYGFNRRKELNDQERLICFVDIGHSKSSIVFSSFTNNKFTVRSVTTERFLGARNMDIRLADMILNKFIADNSLNLSPSEIKPKQYYRLVESVSFARKTLTANQEARISIDSFYDDLDINHKLTKKDFENSVNEEVVLIQNLVEMSLLNYSSRMNIEVSKALEHIHSVEMAGDALRIPVLQRVVEEVFKKRLSKTLAPDELISKGACIYSIMQSKAFSLNYDFNLVQYSSFEVSIGFNVRREKTNSNDESDYKMNYCLLKKTDSLPIRKVYKISNPLDEIEFEFFSGNDNLKKYLLSVKNNSNISKFTAFNNSYLELNIYIDINGIIWFDKCGMFSKTDRLDSIQLLPMLVEEHTSMDYLKFQELKALETEMELNDEKVEQAKNVFNDLEHRIYEFRVKTEEALQEGKIELDTSLFPSYNSAAILFKTEKKIIGEVFEDFDGSVESIGNCLMSDYELVMSVSEEYKKRMTRIVDLIELKKDLFRECRVVKKKLVDCEITMKQGKSQAGVNEITLFIEKIDADYFDGTLDLKGNIDQVIKKMRSDLTIMGKHKSEIN